MCGSGEREREREREREQTDPEIRRQSAKLHIMISRMKLNI